MKPHSVPTVVVRDSEQDASLTSGDLTVRVSRGGDWRVEFWGGVRTLTHSGWRAVGYLDTPAGRFIHEQLGLGVGENVYGLGERFTPL
jgi:alpha-D-xyloside xylohydrolase